MTNMHICAAHEPTRDQTNVNHCGAAGTREAGKRRSGGCGSPRLQPFLISRVQAGQGRCPWAAELPLLPAGSLPHTRSTSLETVFNHSPDHPDCSFTYDDSDDPPSFVVELKGPSSAATASYTASSGAPAATASGGAPAVGAQLWLDYGPQCSEELLLMYVTSCPVTSHHIAPHRTASQDSDPARSLPVQ